MEKTLWSLLQITPGATNEQIESAYQLVTKLRPSNFAEIRFAWKVLRDPYYRVLYQVTGTIVSVTQAGFFDDMQDQDSLWLNENPRLLATPYQKIIDNLTHVPVGQKGVILITTGSFSPLHQGHIDMMEKARIQLESQGRYVVGGYIIPAHDSYVSTKNRGEAGMSAALRVHLAQVAVHQSDWLMVDSSEAFCNPCDRNFTAVFARVKKYIAHHFGEYFDFFYVFGQDVAGFEQAFSATGEGICITRDTTKTDETTSFSSTRVRKGEYHLLATNSQALYQHWQEQFGVIKQYDDRHNFYYHIRFEGVGYYQRIFAQLPPERVAYAVTTFFKKLVRLFQQVYTDALPPSQQFHVKISPIYLDRQRKKLAERKLELPTICMDPCVDGNYQLGVSRLFSLSDGQITGNRLVARPGMKELPEQTAMIPAGDYYLVEDDIGSGQTMSLVFDHIPSTVHIKETILMNKFTNDKLGKEELDIIDLRDFIVGSDHGGLVIQLANGEIARAPYLYPYVNLIPRAKVPYDKAIELSLKIWELNHDFYELLGNDVVLGDLSEAGQKLFLSLGFGILTPMGDISKRHIKQLIKMTYATQLDYNIELMHHYDDEEFFDEEAAIQPILVVKEKIKQIVDAKKSYNITILIDDYRSKNYLKPIEERNAIHQHIIQLFHEVTQKHQLNIDFFAFESMMVKIAKKIIKKIPATQKITEFYKKKNTYVTQLRNQGFRIELTQEWNGEVKYSCALLSAAWILCRLGLEQIPSDRLVSVRGKLFTAKNIITLLPLEYESTENKAKVILLSAGYADALDRIESLYY